MCCNVLKVILKPKDTLHELLKYEIVIFMFSGKLFKVCSIIFQLKAIIHVINIKKKLRSCTKNKKKITMYKVFVDIKNNIGSRCVP